MLYQYVVTLKKDSDRTIDILSFLLCLSASINFIFVQIRSGHLNYFLSLAAGIILAGVIANIFFLRRGKQVRYKYWLLLSALGWLGMPYLQWLTLLFGALAFLEYQTKRPLEVGFHHDRVVINSLIRRQYSWSAFSNVIMKDGLLTLDFSDNRLFQKEVLDDEDREADEDEFNDYCRERLAQAGEN